MEELRLGRIVFLEKSELQQGNSKLIAIIGIRFL